MYKYKNTRRYLAFLLGVKILSRNPNILSLWSYIFTLLNPFINVVRMINIGANQSWLVYFVNGGCLSINLYYFFKSIYICLLVIYIYVYICYLSNLSYRKKCGKICKTFHFNNFFYKFSDFSKDS